MKRDRGVEDRSFAGGQGEGLRAWALAMRGWGQGAWCVGNWKAAARAGEGTPSPSLQGPQSFITALDGGGYTRWEKRTGEKTLASAPGLFCCRLLPARLLSELALRILPRDQNLNRSLPPETRKHSHHVHFALLLWAGAIPLGFQSGNTSTWRPHGLAWPRL